MRNLAEEALNSIKSNLRVQLFGGDQDALGISFTHPEPDEHCHPSVRQEWERLKKNHKLPKDFTDRLSATNDCFKAVQEASTIQEGLILLKSLQVYLEAQAERPIVDSGWANRGDGTPMLWNVARNTRIDKFFEERVLVVVRKAIADMERLATIAPSQLLNLSASLKATPEDIITTGPLSNYHRFIEEIKRLEIGTIDRFVKDGRILYNYDVKHYDAIPEYPSDQLPGHRSTFLCLDQYDERAATGRYSHLLERLADKAEDDLLALPLEQRKAYLGKLNRERERMIDLMKQEIVYLKAHRNENLDDLPACFLDMLLDRFIIPHRPSSSADAMFAERLDDAVKYKLAYLNYLIHKVEASYPSLETKPPQNDTLAITSTASKTSKAKRLNTQKKNAAILTYFRQQVRHWIGKAFIAGKEPDPKSVLKAAFHETIERQNISAEKLRKDITPAMQAEMFGIIYQDELSHKPLYHRPKK